MRKRVSIKTINKNKTSKTLLNVFMLAFIMFIIGISTVYALSYTVSYNNNGGSGTMSNSTFTSNPGTLRTNTFTKSGYKFMGWNKNSGGTSDWYRETNSITGTDGSSTTLYAQWCKNSAGTIKISNSEQKDSYGNYVFRNNKYITVTADNKTINYGGTPSYSYTVTGTLNGESGVTGTASYTVKNSSNTTINPSSAAVGSYTIYVSGLSAASGYSIQNTNTGTLTINKADNPMTFTTPQSGSVSFSTSAQSKTFTAAANAQGAVTYTIQSQKQGSTNVSYFTMPTNNTSASMSVAASTPVGTYTIVVRASAAGNGNYNTKTLDMTYTLTVSAQKCATPTPSITTAGIVTWTASSNCSSAQHQISIDGTNWTNASSGYNYLSTIIAGTGTRTVRVRAVAPNSNYTTSEIGTASVTVYAITFASNNTNKGTVSPTTYNVISGATVETSGNNLLIKGVTSGTSTTTLTTIIPTAKTGYHYSSWSKTSGSLTSAQTITATFTGNTYTATFYYQSNTTLGSTTISSSTESCTVSSGTTCEIDPYTAIYNSGGTYNNDFWGFATTPGTMEVGTDARGEYLDGQNIQQYLDGTIMIDANTDFYSIYSTYVKVYKPATTATCNYSNTEFYRNQWFTSKTAMATTVLSTTRAGTTNNASYTPLSGYSLSGFATAYGTNTTTYSDLTALKNSSATTAYAILSKTVTANFYYNSNTTVGETTISTAQANGTKYLRCTSNNAAGTSDSNYTIPTVVQNSVGTYNNAYIGVTNILESMSPITPTTADTVFWAIYRTNVTNYYWNGSAYTSRTLYRNQSMSGNQSFELQAVYISSDLENHNACNGAQTYNIEMRITLKEQGVPIEGVPIRYGSTTGYTNAEGYVTTIFDADCQEDEITIGNNPSAYSFASSDWPTLNNSEVNYEFREEIRYYRDTVLTTSTTGLTNYTTAVGPGSSFWAGLSTAQDTTAEYSSVFNAARSTSTTLWTVYRFNISYAKGSNVTSIGETSDDCNITTSNTSCSVTLPSITANTGYHSVGWNTTSGATTGTAAGATYTITTNNTTLYANAVANQYTLTADSNGGDIPITTGWTLANSQGSNTYTETYESISSSISGDYDYCCNTSKPSIDTNTGKYSFSGHYINGYGLGATSYYCIFDNMLPDGDGNGNSCTASNVTYIYAKDASVALWKRKYYGVVNTIVSTATKTVTYNSEYGTLPTPTKTDYIFDGWYTAATGGTAVNSSTIHNITDDRTIYAHWSSPVTYNAGATCSGATNMPASQAKSYNVALTLRTEEPTCSGKVFLGWSTASTATASSTWYDPGANYSTDEPLTLYAQFYDVDSLEEAYTTYVESGSTNMGAGSDFRIIHDAVTTEIASGKASNYALLISPYSGYSTKHVSYFANTSSHRIYKLSPSSITMRNINSSSMTHNLDFIYLNIKTRTATSYTNDSVDTRIDRLQKIQDVAIKMDEIKLTSGTVDNISISGTAASGTISASSGYYFIGWAGFNLSNASSSGTSVSRAFLWAPNYGAAGEYAASSLSYSISKSYSSATPKVKIIAYGIQVKQKQARTTTFAPTSAKGLARYNALVALDSAKGDYFTADSVKVSSKFVGSNVTTTAWGSGTASKTLTIPNGKILGVAGYGVENNTSSSGSGESFAVISKAYLSGTSDTTKTFNMTFYGGNKSMGVTTGNAMKNVRGFGYAIYISSGTLSAS